MAEGDTSMRANWPRRTLGRTGLEISALGIGTVELGLPYGIPKGGQLPSPPRVEEGVELLHKAFASGVDFVDTAPGYGRAEQVVGAALASWSGPRPVVATKVFCPSLAELSYPPALRRGIRRSIEGSLRNLGLTRLALLQVHNATEEALASPELAGVLREMVDCGLVEHLGATTYEAEATRAGIAAPWCETLQIAYNVLAQEPAGRLIGLAGHTGTGIIARSALLKGVLTDRSARLPEELRPLAPSIALAAEISDSLGESLAQTALRFVLSDPRVATTVVGVDRPRYLDAAITAWQAPPLPPRSRAALAAAHTDSELTDPRTWSF